MADGGISHSPKPPAFHDFPKTVNATRNLFTRFGNCGYMDCRARAREHFFVASLADSVGEADRAHWDLAIGIAYLLREHGIGVEHQLLEDGCVVVVAEP